MSEELMVEESIEAAESGKGRGRKASAMKDLDQAGKVKVVFNVGPEHAMNRFTEQCKIRGIKNVELGEIILSALQEVGDAWWDNKLEELTPLEYRINAALSDPNMREKLQELLASQVAKMTPQ